MKKELKAWRMRIQSRNRQAEKEREKKVKILAEVHDSFYYLPLARKYDQFLPLNRT